MGGQKCKVNEENKRLRDCYPLMESVCSGGLSVHCTEEGDGRQLKKRGDWQGEKDYKTAG